MGKTIIADEIDIELIDLLKSRYILVISSTEDGRIRIAYHVTDKEGVQNSTPSTRIV